MKHTKGYWRNRKKWHPDYHLKVYNRPSSHPSIAVTLLSRQAETIITTITIRRQVVMVNNVDKTTVLLYHNIYG